MLSLIFVVDAVGVAVFVYCLPLCAFVQVRQSKNLQFLNAKPNSNSTKKCLCTSVNPTESDVAKMVALQQQFEFRHTPPTGGIRKCDI